MNYTNEVKFRINSNIEVLLTNFSFRYLQLYLYIYLDILTHIRVFIHSLNLRGTNNYMSINTIVYLQLYVINI